MIALGVNVDNCRRAIRSYLRASITTELVSYVTSFDKLRESDLIKLE
jgi:hypothetical protein